ARTTTPPTGQETGIDLGLEACATRADGTMLHTPRCSRTAERALKTAQRRVARRTRGSTRRKKAVKLLARAHQTVKRQRLECDQKTAVQLVHKSDTIYHADVQVANLVKNHPLATSLSDAGWRLFLTIRAFKAACAGKQGVAVPPASTSQTCSGCGVVVK